MKPTELQVKELWEWCGLRKTNYWWFAPSGRHLTSTTPPITVDNLFKFAVPKARRILFENGQNIRHSYDRLFKLWLDKWVEGYELEEALFWALQQVKVNS